MPWYISILITIGKSLLIAGLRFLEGKFPSLTPFIDTVIQAITDALNHAKAAAAAK